VQEVLKKYMSRYFVLDGVGGERVAKIVDRK